MREWHDAQTALARQMQHIDPEVPVQDTQITFHGLAHSSELEADVVLRAIVVFAGVAQANDEKHEHS